MIEIITQIGLATGIARSAPIYATTSALHVLGIALLLGPILLVDLALLGRITAFDARAIAALRATARIGVMLVLVTGALLFSARPAEYVANKVFLVKMAVVAAAVANALAFERLTRRVGPHHVLSSNAGRRFAALSLGLWLAALYLGRWIAFV